MTHSNIYPLSYSNEVYKAVGRVTMQCKSTNDMMRLINQANVLNFELKYKDARSLAFIDHMTQLLDDGNEDVPAYGVIMAAALEYMPERHWIEDKYNGSEP